MDVATAARSLNFSIKLRLAFLSQPRTRDAPSAENLPTRAPRRLGDVAGQRRLFKLAIFGGTARFDGLERRAQHLEESQKRSLPHAPTGGIEVSDFTPLSPAASGGAK